MTQRLARCAWLIAAAFSPTLSACPVVDPGKDDDCPALEDCECSATATCLACYTEDELFDDCETDTDTDADSDSDSDADADTDTDTDTGTELCLHVGVAPNSGADYQYVTHCHTIGGPDLGADVGFYSPYWTNSNSDCYQGEHVAPTSADAVDEDSFYASITEPALGGVGGLCPMFSGSGDWSYEFEPTTGWECTDYTDEGHGWTKVDANGNQLQEGDSLYGCGYYDYAPVARAGFEVSTPVPCVAGSARFDLVARHMPGEGDVNGRSVLVTPIARTDARFPERAWLRSISVVSWNDATKLYVSDDGTLFNSAGGLIGTADLVAPATSLTKAAGVIMMGAHFAIPAMEAGDDLPVVDLSWSCEVNTGDPHFTVLTGHDSYIANLSEWGISHRFLFHVDATNHMLRIAPVGRYRDSVQMGFDSTGHFAGYLPTLHAKLEGIMSISGTNLEIDAGRVSVGLGGDPIEVEVFGELLPPLP